MRILTGFALLALALGSVSTTPAIAEKQTRDLLEIADVVEALTSKGFDVVAIDARGDGYRAVLRNGAGHLHPVTVDRRSGRIGPVEPSGLLRNIVDLRFGG